MPFKINISNKEGKTYKLELESEELIGKSLHDKIDGKEILPDLDGYELEITGATDKAGFMAHEDVEGFGLNKLLLSLGRGMHKRPKGIKKKAPRPKKGLRLRRTVRGKVISENIIQINLKVVKEGHKKLQDIFPEQNKGKGAKEEKKEEVEAENE